MQRSFDDLGTPLADVTFCVVDLETTGGSPDTCGITEIGAVKVRGGHVEGTFQTLVNPGCAIPPEITVLTGITHAMVMPAPRIESVLPAFVEFSDGCVIVGHNVRFDVSFLNAALERDGWPRLQAACVDTAALARRLVRDEVANCRLGTLAAQLRLDHKPSHRALDDALATVDLLHVLLERAAGLGVCGLDDLLALPRLGGHPQVHKLRLTERLPRCPGVYLFRGARGEVLYVGKATDLRSRVRSYFSGDERRKVGALLREVHAIDHVRCSSVLEASVLEIRLIQQHEPHYNRQVKGWRAYAYVKLTLDEPFPRLTIAKSAKADGSLYLGPLPSAAMARLVVEAIETAIPLRRCTTRIGRRRRVVHDAPCTAAQLGVAVCPCTGTLSEAAYAPIVARAVRALTVDPAIVLDPLAARMAELAASERFEEAAAARDRAAAFANALRRQRRSDALRAAGRVRLELPGGGGVEVVRGVLVDAWASGEERLRFDGADAPDDGPLPAHLADEVAAIAGYLDTHGDRVRIAHADQGLAHALPRLPSFSPASPRTGRDR